MKFTKVLSLVLSALMIFMLASCGGQTETGGTQGDENTPSGNAVSITFWNPITGPDSAYMQTLVADFNKEYAGRYRVDSDAQAESSHYQRILTSFTDNSTADVCIIHMSRVPSFYRADKLRDMDGLLSAAGVSQDKYIDTLWNSCNFEGKMYAVPLDVLPTVIFYNRKLIPAGYTEDDIRGDGFTLDKMLEMMSAAYVDAPISNKKIYGMSFNYSFTEPMFLSFLNQQGVYAVSEDDPSKPTFDCEEGYKAAEAVMKIPFTSNSDGKKVSSESGADHLNIFVQGRALFTIDGIWSAPSACEKTEKVDAGVALLPRLDSGTAQKVASDGHCIAAFKNKSNSDEKDEAIAAFIKYLTDNNTYWCRGGKVSAQNGSTAVVEYSALEWSYLSYRLSDLVPPVKVYTYDTITDPIGKYVAQLCEGTATDVKANVSRAAKDAAEMAAKLK